MKMNNLEDLFKSELEDFRPEIDFEEKLLIDNIQIKTQFYQFTPYRFNIYYALSIVSGLLITLCCAGHYIYTINKAKELNANVKPILNKDNNSQFVDIQKDNSFKNTQDQVSNSTDKIKKTGELSNKITTKISSSNKIDSSKINSTINPTSEIKLPDLKQVVKEQAPVIKIDSTHKPNTHLPLRKKVVIVKRDTIYQTDTLKLKKKKK